LNKFLWRKKNPDFSLKAWVKLGGLLLSPANLSWICLLAEYSAKGKSNKLRLGVKAIADKSQVQHMVTYLLKLTASFFPPAPKKPMRADAP